MRAVRGSGRGTGQDSRRSSRLRGLLAFATSALRDAENSVAVLARVDGETGVALPVLPGEDEARYTFLAVRRWYGWSAGRLLVLDIGGGSLELAAGRDEDPEVAMSLPSGRRSVDPRPLATTRQTRREIEGAGRKNWTRCSHPRRVRWRGWGRMIWRSARRRRSGRWPGSPGPRRRARGCGSAEA